MIDGPVFPVSISFGKIDENRLINQEGYTIEGARRQLAVGKEKKSDFDSNTEMDLNDLAETMSNFLLQKMFEQARFEKHNAEVSVEEFDNNNIGGLK